MFFYKQRFTIETFFSDQKSRGFRLDRSHLSDPARLGRLMSAACLAYQWLIYLGTLAFDQDWQDLIARGDRVDLSLFSLGGCLLVYLFNQLLPIPIGFRPWLAFDDWAALS